MPNMYPSSDRLLAHVEDEAATTATECQDLRFDPTGLRSANLHEFYRRFLRCQQRQAVLTSSAEGLPFTDPEAQGSIEEVLRVFDRSQTCFFWRVNEDPRANTPACQSVERELNDARQYFRDHYRY